MLEEKFNYLEESQGLKVQDNYCVSLDLQQASLEHKSNARFFPMTLKIKFHNGVIIIIEILLIERSLQ